MRILRIMRFMRIMRIMRELLFRESTKCNWLGVVEATSDEDLGHGGWWLSGSYCDCLSEQSNFCVLNSVSRSVAEVKQHVQF